MNQRSIFTLSAITVLGLASLPGSTVAQQKSLKEQLVGAWTLVSCESTYANGTKRSYCVSPNGVLMLDASGRYASMTVARGRPKFTVPLSLETKAEEFKAAGQGLAANFGTWSVNEANKTLTTHYDGAFAPNNEGTDLTRSVSLSGDELKLVSQSTVVTGGRTEGVYRRAK
jgi:hypothetical protein